MFKVENLKLANELLKAESSIKIEELEKQNQKCKTDDAVKFNEMVYHYQQLLQEAAVKNNQNNFQSLLSASKQQNNVNVQISRCFRPVAKILTTSSNAEVNGDFQPPTAKTRKLYNPRMDEE